MIRSNCSIFVGYILIAAALCLVSYQQGVINTLKRCNCSGEEVEGAPQFFGGRKKERKQNVTIAATS